MLTLVFCLFVVSGAAAQAIQRVLYTFNAGDDGGWPEAGLTLDNQGNLYGTTNSFGPYGYGTVFKVSASGGSWTESVIHGFCADYHAGCRDGAYPLAGVTIDAQGNLYGTTSYGGGPQSWGVVYKLSPSGGGWDLTRLRNFSNADSYPSAEVTLDRAGHLFGTTLGNPVAGGLGTVFELAPNQTGGWKHRTLADFQGRGGPNTSVAVDRAHNLYGTGVDGIFQISFNQDGTWTMQTIAPNFGGSDLILDDAGNLYGTTSGEIFKLSYVSGQWQQTPLYAFGANDGGRHSGLIFDSAGNLYGTSSTGGLPGCLNGNGCGSVFKLTKTQSGWSFSILYQFTGGTDGGYPVGGVVIDQQGNLYGATNVGGKSGCHFFGCGVVYQITP